MQVANTVQASTLSCYLGHHYRGQYCIFIVGYIRDCYYVCNLLLSVRCPQLLCSLCFFEVCLSALLYMVSTSPAMNDCAGSWGASFHLTSSHIFSNLLRWEMRLSRLSRWL